MIKGWKTIKVMIRDDDYQTLLRAQAAFRQAIDSPSEDARLEAWSMLRAAESIAAPALCSAAEIHEQEAH